MAKINAAVNLFAGAAVKPKETKKTPDKKIIPAPVLGEKIGQYNDLKATIEATTGQLKMIEGDIKTEGRRIWLEQYQQQRCTPENFLIQDKSGATCMFICIDKYMMVDQTKAEILQNYDGLLSEKTVYTFNPELVDKYAAVLSNLIMNCKDIAEEDKTKLISGERTYSIEKGSINRLLQYDNPAQVLELMNPIVSLKK